MDDYCGYRKNESFSTGHSINMRTLRWWRDREMISLTPLFGTNRIDSIVLSKTDCDVPRCGYCSYTDKHTLQILVHSSHDLRPSTNHWQQLGDFLDYLVGFQKTTETNWRNACINMSNWNSKITWLNQLHSVVIVLIQLSLYICNSRINHMCHTYHYLVFNKIYLLLT